jgi:ribosome biogenesis GTPase / thiamine phosphate phosphatase
MIEHKGIVVRSTGSWYNVKTEKNGMIDCRLRGKFRMDGMKTTNPVAVGDVVHFTINQNDNTGSILKIESRKNCIIRKATRMSKQKHIIASNVDLSVLIATIAFPRTSSGFIDRFLVSAEAYNVPSVIVFNKLDLYESSLLDELHFMKNIYEGAGYQVLEVSALKGTNIDQLKDILKGKTSLVSGHSGVGKSHVINALDPKIDLKTGEISQYHLKGKHTTTFAEMHDLDFGATIIDTPGIKEFGLVDFEPWELGHWFPDFKPYISKCRFSNCTHHHEPGCAIEQAVEEQHIHPSRYYNYLSILNNIEEDAAGEFK